MFLDKVVSLVKKGKNKILELLFKNDVYYINGSDTLPPPLSAEEEEKMIKRKTPQSI